MQNQKPKTYNTKEAANYLHVSMSTIYRYIKIENKKYIHFQYYSKKINILL